MEKAGLATKLAHILSACSVLLYGRWKASFVAVRHILGASVSQKLAKPMGCEPCNSERGKPLSCSLCLTHLSKCFANDLGRMFCVRQQGAW